MKTYKRLGCTVEINEAAEELLKNQNVNIDQFANHLYLFALNQQIEGNRKVTVRASKWYTGEAQFHFSFEQFKLPKELVPIPSTLTCDKSKEPPCHLEPSIELCKKCSLNSGKETK